jgi:hypothetical protein
MKGLGRGGVQGVQELQEFTEATFGNGQSKLAFQRTRLYLLQSNRVGPSLLIELLELLHP